MRISVTIRIEPDDPMALDHIEVQRFAWDSDTEHVESTAALAAEMAVAAVNTARETQA